MLTRRRHVDASIARAGKTAGRTVRLVQNLATTVDTIATLAQALGIQGRLDYVLAYFHACGMLTYQTLSIALTSNSQGFMAEKYEGLYRSRNL